MAKMTFSTKRIQIDKAQATMFGFIAASAFLVVFSLIASRSLLSQRQYQANVITEKEKAKQQLKENLDAAQTLTSAYQQFVDSPENVLGGNAAGRGELDGDNAKIVLDALPSKYDFPALTTSLEKLLNNKNYRIESIKGIDDEVNQKVNSGSPKPVTIDMPFEIKVNGSYPAMQGLLGVLERSIRPFQVEQLEFTGTDATLQLAITAKSFYQPEKNVQITTKVIK